MDSEYLRHHVFQSNIDGKAALVIHGDEVSGIVAVLTGRGAIHPKALQSFATR